MWKKLHIIIFSVPCILIFSYNALSQDILSNLLDILPLEFEIGCWSIYEVKDFSTKTTVLLREAITGEEMLNNQKCYWLEAEVIPTIGFPSIYRFLIQPEKNGKHKILKIVVREGANLPETYLSESVQSQEEKSNARKKFIKEEEIEYKSGKIKAKHYTIKTEEKEVEVWTTSEIKPLGLVKLRSKDGEVTLIRYGKGGEEAKSNLEISTRRDYKSEEDKKSKNGDVAVKVEKE